MFCGGLCRVSSAPQTFFTERSITTVRVSVLHTTMTSPFMTLRMKTLALKLRNWEVLLCYVRVTQLQSAWI